MIKTISYREALNLAMTQEMERDSSVFTYGLDVSDHKRIFGSTVGLVEKFGSDRCFGTPLSEDAMTGFEKISASLKTTAKMIEERMIPTFESIERILGQWTLKFDDIIV